MHPAATDYFETAFTLIVTWRIAEKWQQTFCCTPREGPYLRDSNFLGDSTSPENSERLVFWKLEVVLPALHSVQKQAAVGLNFYVPEENLSANSPTASSLRQFPRSQRTVPLHFFSDKLRLELPGDLSSEIPAIKLDCFVIKRT